MVIKSYSKRLTLPAAGTVTDVVNTRSNRIYLGLWVERGQGADADDAVDRRVEFRAVGTGVNGGPILTTRDPPIVLTGKAADVAFKAGALAGVDTNVRYLEVWEE